MSVPHPPFSFLTRVHYREQLGSPQGLLWNGEFVGVMISSVVCPHNTPPTLKYLEEMFCFCLL